MNPFLQKSALLLCSFFIAFFSQSQTTNTYTTSATWNVPAGVSSLSIKVYGGGGGTGGQDCGAGCGNSAASNTGYVLATYNVSPGDIIGIYPGTKGGDGGNSVSGIGGGTAGVASYGAAYNGGTGGNAGSSGSSGGGGGGGAASVITINSVIKIVAGGAGGGGGMANMAGSGLPGNSTTSPNGTSNTGGNGTTPGGDGGGGGAGGGGQYGSTGGGVHAAGGESAGNGGNVGGNSVTGASAVTTNGTIVWTNTGQIEVTYTVVVPVTWLGFSAEKQNNSTVLLNWSTATEANTKEYVIQRSNNNSDWTAIGTIAAAGNSSTKRDYNFTDNNPLSSVAYYRLLQRDLNGKTAFSKILLFRPDEGSLLKLYPNPVINGTATISLQSAGTVRIFNSTGIMVMQKDYKAGAHILNLSQLPKGVYYIKTAGDGSSFAIQ